MLLEAVAKRLMDVTRDAGVIARFGGDEFVVLQAPINSTDQCEALAKCILTRLGGTYDLDGHKVSSPPVSGLRWPKGRWIQTSF